MRLIDAERLRKDDSMCVGVICDECPFADRLKSRCSFVDCVDRQPTIDPVKHGRWVGGKGEMECSACGELALFDEANCQYITPYCSFCGARMDGDEE